MKKLLPILTILTTLSLSIIQSSLTPVLATELTGTVVPFTDIRNSVHLEAITELSSKGVVSGYADGTFKPSRVINRAEFLKILTETKGTYSPSTEPSDFDILEPVNLDVDFSDLTTRQWYIPYIRFAVKNKIIKGYPDGTFRPEAPINLAEALKMIFLSFDLPTVQFIRAPDHWYDYYTAGLDEKFTLATHLDAKANIGKNLTRGEMASLIVYFGKQTKTVLQKEDTPASSYIAKPLILEKSFKNGSWSLHGFVMFSNGCVKPQTGTKVITSTPQVVELSITEVNDPIGMCQPTPQEHEINFSFTANVDAQVTSALVNGNAVAFTIHDTSMEAVNPYSPLSLTKTATNESIRITGNFTIESCKNVTVQSSIYDGISQQVEIDIVTSDNFSRTNCSQITTEWPIEVTIPSMKNSTTTVRARIDGVPVLLMMNSQP